MKEKGCQTGATLQWTAATEGMQPALQMETSVQTPDNMQHS
jgi:hypothetical protein